jgi:hypothetical protein
MPFFSKKKKCPVGGLLPCKGNNMDNTSSETGPTFGVISDAQRKFNPNQPYLLLCRLTAHRALAEFVKACNRFLTYINHLHLLNPCFGPNPVVFSQFLFAIFSVPPFFLSIFFSRHNHLR